MSNWKLCESYLVHLLCRKCLLFIVFCVPILEHFRVNYTLNLFFQCACTTTIKPWTNQSWFIWCLPCVVTAPGSSLRDDECKIWSGGLQQFTEAHLHLHPILHRGHVAAHQVRGGAEGPGDQPEQLQRPHAVLHLRGRSLHLLPHLRIPAGEQMMTWNTSRSTIKCSFTRLLALRNWPEVCCDTCAGTDIFCGRIQAFRMVPHPGPVWILFHVWTRGAPAHAGQTQEVSNRISANHPSCSSFTQSSQSQIKVWFDLISLLSRIPGKTYMIIAFLTVGTMGLSNTSLGYLNYPTQVIFKCCKLIPVMIGGMFIQGERSRPRTRLAASLPNLSTGKRHTQSALIFLTFFFLPTETKLRQLPGRPAFELVACPIAIRGWYCDIPRDRFYKFRPHCCFKKKWKELGPQTFRTGEAKHFTFPVSRLPFEAVTTFQPLVALASFFFFHLCRLFLVVSQCPLASSAPVPPLSVLSSLFFLVLSVFRVLQSDRSVISSSSSSFFAFLHLLLFFLDR